MTRDRDFRLPVLRQEWRAVTFVHWRYPKAAVQPILPPGLAVEEYHDSAWVTLTPLRMCDVRLPGTPAVPRLSTFPETNLRTYVRAPDGRRGLWFFSLDAASGLLTAAARLLLGAPYFLARLRIVPVGDGIGYTGTRTWRGRADYHLRVQPGPPIRPGGLEAWLTDRWRAYTRHAGWLLEIPVRHEPWPLRAATVTTLEESLTAAAGLPDPGEPALAHYSDGVTDVSFGVARPLTRSVWALPAREGGWPDRTHGR